MQTVTLSEAAVAVLRFEIRSASTKGDTLTSKSVIISMKLKS